MSSVSHFVEKPTVGGEPVTLDFRAVSNGPAEPTYEPASKKDRGRSSEEHPAAKSR